MSDNAIYITRKQTTVVCGYCGTPDTFVWESIYNETTGAEYYEQTRTCPNCSTESTHTEYKVEMAIPVNVPVSLPEIGQEYVTHKSKVRGWVCEIVPNKTGTFRLRLMTSDLETRWTTFVPMGVTY